MPDGTTDHPARLGRYRITVKLGEGGFGIVYKGHDDDLRRDVAIKVPHRDRIARPEDVEAYLAEARVLAGLDHPNIVPVHDVGHTADGLCYVVSKFIEGSDLKSKIERGRPSPTESAALVGTVAEALHYAHRQGLVHRDIKPANILIDTAGKPYVGDFGLALREEDFGTGAGFAGTPAYMSPEQARREGHRVDGRSDIFSLSVVFYELLTGRRPFRGRTWSDLLDQIIAVEARPPRQVDDTIPAALERICLKALSKRATERYTTAKDFAADLRHFLEDSSEDEGPATPVPAPMIPAGAVKVVPKGLRSFDAKDADFFLDLVPGPRDRDGLPESIGFWKTRIEESDPDRTFSVGLIYGPSGCGKTSLVRAGLLPRLADDVLAIYVEATADQTEARLLRELRKNCPGLPGHLALTETLASVRRGPDLPAGKKVCIILDQFEQWLHARRGETTELLQALRHCDGERVQCVVMVRDDFWLAVSRFMAELEVDLLQGQNTALVDLFDPLHARKVLAEFGRAFGRLPDNLGGVSSDQNAFMDQAIAGLSEGGRVISVRLALFAEMVKGKPWSPATLKEVGGTQGVGTTFLEETFSAPAANPKHRLHQNAARAVLKALLPEQGTDIKGNMRSHRELLEASGYTRRPKEFEELLRILDPQLRLITPTEPEEKDEGGRMKDEGKQAADAAASSSSFILHPLSFRYYQLTHDYLVPSLRDWLSRKQKETRRGRAELRLAERAALWATKPENRHLPAWWEFLNIRALTRKKNRTTPQQKMMGKAARYHAVRGLALAVLLAAVTLAGLGIRRQVVERNKATHAAGLVRGLLDADLAQVPGIIEEIEDYRLWADSLLRQEYVKAPEGSGRKLYASMALLPVDPAQVDYLYQRLLRAGPTELPVIRQALRGHRDALVGRLWKVLGNTGQNADRRFRAACTLAAYDTDGGGGSWRAVSKFVVGQLLAAVQENPSHYTPLLETLRPVQDRLLGPLANVFGDRERPEAERSFATTILADYAGDRPDVLADLLMDADEKQFAVVYPKLKDQGDRGLAHLQAELEKQPQAKWHDPSLNASWKEPDPALLGKIEAAHGMLAERFAFCQTMPLKEFVAAAEGLRPSGYRPVRVRPYGHADRVRVAAVWARDGRHWQLVYGVSAFGMRVRQAERRKQGYQPVDVAGYLDGPKERYAAVWVKGGRDDEARLYIGVPEAQHQAAGWGPLRQAKLNPVTLQTLVGADGQVRYSSVWRKTTATGISSWNDDELTHADRGLSDGLPVDVSLRHSRQYIADAQAELLAWLTGSPWAGLGLRSEHPLLPHPERRYAGNFVASAEFDHAVALGLTPQQQVQRCRELAGKGYRPAAFSVAAFPAGGGGQPPGQAEPLVTASVWHRPVVPEDAKERLAKRQANAAVALLRLGQAERVWPLLKHRPDPRMRSYLIHRLGPLEADVSAVASRLDEEKKLSIRRALLLALGEFGPESLARSGARHRLIPKLLQLYEDDPDPGTHGAAEWLLRQWGHQDKLKETEQRWAKDKQQSEERLAGIKRHLAKGKGQAQPRWYVNGQGQTMVVIPGPVEFLMGSPRTEAGREGGPEGTVEKQHRKRISHSFVIAAREVTVEQFLKFREDHNYNKQYAPTRDSPVNIVTWYDAAAYCNWLSKKERIPQDQWCYVPKHGGEFAEGMRVKPDYLSLRGYRLPSEAEWEYACRAGAVTSRYYGEAEDLLGKYAWYTKNSLDRGMLPGKPGTLGVAGDCLKPNDLGLFDMLGNALEWCQDPVFLYQPGTAGRPSYDREYGGLISDKLGRLLRGGSFNLQPVLVRSAYRFWNVPTNWTDIVGIRPARTFR
ncbi:MAG TPA: SUMF1/EgtB/PvdO family nonheme iron enzyme [Gemmataceae bacterium]|nr:SUMF1/EgtB/PvdO family nonheme iron enzyme [Gemmataceae bacterium]